MARSNPPDAGNERGVYNNDVGISMWKLSELRQETVLSRIKKKPFN